MKVSAYVAVHQWVARKLGRPRNCDNCGKKDLRQRQYHWANKSGYYKRDVGDWMRLCVKCHKRKDLERLGLVEKFEYKDQKKSLVEWCEILGLDYQFVIQRIKKHKWSFTDAVEIPKYALNGNYKRLPTKLCEQR